MSSISAKLPKLKSDFFQLNFLHILNDGFLASLLLLLPFIAKTDGLNLTKVGVLGTVLNVFSIVLALPAAAIVRKMGGMRTLAIALVIYGIGFLGTSVIGAYSWLPNSKKSRLRLLILMINGTPSSETLEPESWSWG